MTLRTYGDKPMSFQLEENGEYFYVGSEVKAFLRCMTAKADSTPQQQTHM